MPEISQEICKEICTGIFKGMCGAFAVALTFGAVQFASGRDLSASSKDRAAAEDRLQNDPSGTPPIAVNRAAKADRVARATEAGSQTQTISLRLDGQSDTSFLVRIPAREARNRPSAPLLTKSGDRKPAVACEPVVSVLTEVAKHLEPGRCVT